MFSRTRIAVALAAACLASPPAFADREKDERGDGRSHEQRYERHDRDGDRHGRHHDDHDRHHGRHAQVKVPPGHLPPPGECRIWYPDRPPGHQPPPGDCRELSRRVPHDAVLVEG